MRESAVLFFKYFIIHFLVGLALLRLSRPNKEFEKATLQLSQSEKDKLCFDHECLSKSPAYLITFITVTIIWMLLITGLVSFVQIQLLQSPIRTEYSALYIIPWIFAGLSTSRIPMRLGYRLFYGKETLEWYDKIWTLGDSTAFNSNKILRTIARISVAVGLLTSLHILTL